MPIQDSSLTAAYAKLEDLKKCLHRKYLQGKLSSLELSKIHKKLDAAMATLCTTSEKY